MCIQDAKVSLPERPQNLLSSVGRRYEMQAKELPSGAVKSKNTSEAREWQSEQCKRSQGYLAADTEPEISGDSAAEVSDTKDV